MAMKDTQCDDCGLLPYRHENPDLIFFRSGRLIGKRCMKGGRWTPLEENIQHKKNKKVQVCSGYVNAYSTGEKAP